MHAGIAMKCVVAHACPNTIGETIFVTWEAIIACVAETCITAHSLS